MKAIGWVFLFCVVGIIVTSAVLWGESALVSILPKGYATQQVTSNLIVPLEILVVLFVIGAVVSLFIWIRSSDQPQPD